MRVSFVCMLYSIIFFFFFQAEDGIRDDLVTGVQTCALPIYGWHPAGRRTACRAGGWRGGSEGPQDHRWHLRGGTDREKNRPAFISIVCRLVSGRAHFFEQDGFPAAGRQPDGKYIGGRDDTVRLGNFLVICG